MHVSGLCCAILFLFLQICQGIQVKELTMDDMKQILTVVPEDDWQPFLKEKTQIGYQVKEQQAQWEDEEEAVLGVEIFTYFVNNQEDIRKRKDLLNGSIAQNICFPEPIGCIDTDDPGIRPL